MKKGKINALINQDSFAWFTIMPNDNILDRLHQILQAVDEKFENDESQYFGELLEHESYDEICPGKVILRYNEKAYGIIFLNKNAVELILFKDNKIYKFFFDLMRKNFSYFFPFAP